MSDVFVVISERSDGRRKARCVLAADQKDARWTHEEHYPDDHIVAVKAQGCASEEAVTSSLPVPADPDQRISDGRAQG
jgi:hypothetical protein